MSHFTPGELAYMREQRLGRLATIDADGAPNNVPVTFRYNPTLDSIDIGGFKMGTSKKFRNVQRDGRVSFVIDDVLPPWEARGVEIRGVAEALDTDGGLIRIQARHIISWGIDTEPYTRNSRKVGAASAE
ncbi:MAG: PPOX class F420-dependent oxidoreductase [Pleurocapsa minor GSE-CHR-MK-17-07R]|jgi:pyridoxamine 5'-phosphate oxidase family protein|nr:PPOX class F420-dependent oxidoreductase [Pleurocapsa minor GSE-CHR-MK 17-07R]